MKSNTEGINKEVNKKDDKAENKVEKKEIKKLKQIINKDSSLDTNYFLLPEITDYRCIICENIPNYENAYEAICCGLLFCKECLLKWIDQKPKCPICKKDLKNDTKFIRNIKDNNKLFYKTLRKFIIKCPYECNWTGPWEDLEKHLNECDRGYRECKYKDIGCEFIDEKDKILDHEKNNDKLHLDLAMKFIKDNQKTDNINNINNININNDDNNNRPILIRRINPILPLNNNAFRNPFLLA